MLKIDKFYLLLSFISWTFAPATGSARGIENIVLRKMLDEDYKDRFMRVSCKSSSGEYLLEIIQIGDFPTPVFSADGTEVRNRFQVAIFDKDGLEVEPKFEAESLFYNREIQFTSSTPEFILMAAIINDKAFMAGKFQGVLECTHQPLLS